MQKYLFTSVFFSLCLLVLVFASKNKLKNLPFVASPMALISSGVSDNTPLSGLGSAL